MSVDFEEYRKNPETHPDFNRQPGVVIVPGSPYANELAKWEQFPSKYTEGVSPGNPYRYKPYPKMLYRAERVNGSPVCMAAEPDPIDFRDPRELDRAQAAAMRFTQKCQLIVNDEREHQKAMEGGWRETPDDAVAFLIERDQKFSKEDAHRAWDDRHMSDAAKREIREAKDAVGGDPTPEIPEKPRARRGRPPKSDSAA